MKKFGVSILLIAPLIVFPQDWIRIYGDDISGYAYSVIETYDKGYIYAGQINDNTLTPLFTTACVLILLFRIPSPWIR